MISRRYDDLKDNITLYIITKKDYEKSSSELAHHMKNDMYEQLYEDYKKDKELNSSKITAWSDNKTLIKYYLDFHNCDTFQTIKVEGTLEEYSDLLNDNIHDEITIANIRIRDSEKPYKEKVLQIPATETEMDLLLAEEDSYSSGRIDYGVIEKYYHRMKNKYKKIFDNILLTDVMMKVIHGNDSNYLEKIKQDQLAILYRLFSGYFD